MVATSVPLVVPQQRGIGNAAFRKRDACGYEAGLAANLPQAVSPREVAREVREDDGAERPPQFFCFGCFTTSSQVWTVSQLLPSFSATVPVAFTRLPSNSASFFPLSSSTTL